MDDKIAIVTCTQGDFRYIDEWIQWHRNIGVDLFLIGYNGKKEDFCKMPKYDYIRYFDFSVDENNEIYGELGSRRKYGAFSGWDSVEDFENHDMVLMNSMLNIMIETLKMLFHQVHWCCVIDTDEFIDIVDNESKDLKEFFKKNFPESNSSYSIGMQFYDDNDLIYYEDKPITERFTRKTPSYHVDLRNSGLTKIVLNLFNDDMRHGFKCPMTSPHICGLGNSGKFHFDFDKIQLRHYWTKTLEEWISKMNPDIDKDYFRRFKGNVIYCFFKDNNKITPEKLRAIPGLLKKYHLEFYHPENEEENLEFRKLYKEANNIQ